MTRFMALGQNQRTRDFPNMDRIDQDFGAGVDSKPYGIYMHLHLTQTLHVCHICQSVGVVLVVNVGIYMYICESHTWSVM